MVVHCYNCGSEMQLIRGIDYGRDSSPYRQNNYSVEYGCLKCSHTLNIGLDGGHPTLFLKSEEQVSEYFDEKVKFCVDCKKQFPIQRKSNCNECNGELQVSTRLLVSC